MSEVKIVFKDVLGKVEIRVEGDIPNTDNPESMSNAELMAMSAFEQIKMQEILQSLVNEKKDLTNLEEDDKTKYRN